MLSGILFAAIAFGVLALVTWTIRRDRSGGDISTGFFGMRDTEVSEDPEDSA